MATLRQLTYLLGWKNLVTILHTFRHAFSTANWIQPEMSKIKWLTTGENGQPANWGGKKDICKGASLVMLQTVLIKCTWLHHNVFFFNLSSLGFCKNLFFWWQMLRFIANGGIVRIIFTENIFWTLPICPAPCSGLCVYFLIKSSLRLSEAGTVTLSNL